MLADIARDVYEALRFMTQLLTKDVSQGVTIASTISSGKIRGLLISEEKKLSNLSAPVKKQHH